MRLKLSSEPFLLLFAILTGLVTGGAAVLFKWMIHTVSHFGLDRILAAEGWERLALGLLVPVTGATIVAVIIKLINKGKRGHGVADVMEQVNLREGYVTGKAAWLAPLNASFVLGTGNSAGPEGPIVHAGAGIGSFLGRYGGMPTPRVKTLVMCGCAAALAAMYNAPIAGTLFTLEVIAIEFNAGVMALSLISAVAASVVAQAFHGASPAFAVPIYQVVSRWELPAYALLGALCGLIAHLYNRSIHRTEHLFEQFRRIPVFWRPAVGAAIVGLVGLLFPEILGRGEETIEHVLHGGAEYGLLMLALLSVVKLFATATTLGSGQPGGVFTPALFVGATAGGAFGWALHGLFPGEIAGPGAYALVGMGAVLAGSMRAPITGVVLLFELTGDYRIILPLMLAAGASYILVSRLYPESIYTQILAEKGVDLKVGRGNLLRTITVAEAMTTRIDSVQASDSLADVIALMQTVRHSGFPVLDGEKVVGVITLGDIRATPVEGRLERSVSSVMSSKLIGTHPDETLHTALVRMQDKGIGRLLVLDDNGDLVGLLTRTDALKAYHRKQLMALPASTQ